MTTITDPTTPVEHADAMGAVWDAITGDCLLLGIKPYSVTVSAWTIGHLEAAVFFSAQAGEWAAVDAVDKLGNACRLPADPGGFHVRQGTATLAGRTVKLRISCVKPKHPRLPAGYAPQEVA